MDIAKIWDEYTDDNMYTDIGRFPSFLVELCEQYGRYRKDLRILEAGCNVGNNLAEFVNKPYKIHGIDFTIKAVTQAQERYPNFHISFGDIRTMPYEDNYFDIVFTRGVLIHIINVHQALDELIRVTKHGGYIFNFEYDGEDGKPIKWKRGDNLLWYRDMRKLYSMKKGRVIRHELLPLEIDPNISTMTIFKKI